LITEENKEAETKKLIKEIDDHLHKIEERLEIKE
jgi:ABC-type Fe3+-hydroxamate transport system substrate-binding protein